jgi:predicted esterase
MAASADLRPGLAGASARVAERSGDHEREREQLRDRLAAALLRGRPRPSNRPPPPGRPTAVPSLGVALVRGRRRPAARLASPAAPVAAAGLPPHGGGVLWSRVVVAAPDPCDAEQAGVSVLVAETAEARGAARPCVVLLHGTGACGESLAPRAAELARLGFLVAVPDARHHGRRAKRYASHAVPGGNDQYQQALVAAWETRGKTRPFVYDSAADMFYLADYLESRGDVSSLGITGVSLGGMHAWFAAAADVRWACAAPMIGVQSFSFAVENGCAAARVATIPAVFERAAAEAAAAGGRRDPCCGEVVRSVWDTLCPGLLGEFDSLQTLPLIAPRALFVGNGRDDPRCPAEGLLPVFGAVRAEFARLGRGGRCELKLYDCAHECTDEMWADVKVFLCQSLLRGE